MRKKIGLALLSIFIVLAAVIYSGRNKEQKEETLFKKEALEFWVISDPHYIDKSLTDSGTAYKKIKQTAAGKELDYQEESWQALIDKALEEKPDMLIITGDLTLNGEKASAEKLAGLLKRLTEKGIKTFVIPGNHDINDGWARKFVGDKQEQTEAISIADFKKIFADNGYQNATTYDKNSLSYSVAVNEQYNFLFLDSNIYPEDNQPKTRPNTGGTIRRKTMKWVEKQLDEGKQAKKKTLVFMHHNIYAHNKLLSSGFVLNNAKTVKQLLAQYQVPVVFSGHIHAQDIMTETVNDEQLTEIVSGSFSITPQGYGVVNLKGNSFNYQRKENDVASWAKGKNITTPQIRNYQEYLKEVFVEDGKRLAYAQLIDSGMTDEKQMDIAADFVGKMNVRFFSGNDYSTDEEVKKIQKESGYRIIAENSKFLKDYIDSIIQDKNEEDNSLAKEF
ncbi:hypothetical protein A5881_001427 [Enterococcus termitis]|nr:hypothetical protein A5881_002846 [Enterococcus termitis]